LSYMMSAYFFTHEKVSITMEFICRDPCSLRSEGDGAPRALCHIPLQGRERAPFDALHLLLPLGDICLLANVLGVLPQTDVRPPLHAPVSGQTNIVARAASENRCSSTGVSAQMSTF